LELEGNLKNANCLSKYKLFSLKIAKDTLFFFEKIPEVSKSEY
jgi:hypothetical protein